MRTFSTLYGLDSKGRMKVWNIGVFPPNSPPAADREGATIITQYGLGGGKMQESRDLITEGKNLGKSNETTPFEQACLEAESKWNKQLDKGYVTDSRLVSAAAEKPMPMLAHRYDKRSHNIVWPAMVQPKLDGIRMLAHVEPSGVKFVGLEAGPGVEFTSREAGGVKFTTRLGKPISTVDHLAAPLQAAFPAGAVVDGELFNPELDLQEIVSGKGKASDISDALQFWIYDLVNDKPAANRQRTITEALGVWTPASKCPAPPITACLVRCPTFDCPDEAEMLEAYNGFLTEGYEGAIVRNMDGLYKRGKRSADLQKVKPTECEEFKIIGVHEGRGKDRGCPTWECVTEDGKEFSARMKGKLAARQKMMREADKYMGAWLTVEFACYTPAGKPFHGRGIVIRDYE